ncbi:IS66 family transposase [Clostridium formicaceticum]|uniref:Transposase IS66 family protein n=3 Tax=Clostridium formicaceticum TaxID=1497 RepID=A0AAC9RMZ9_9CLOT|nr:IS66 family transposase [Clostridium formicaceticum]ARE86627.1 Transposase IS66 family protein [Clostridium formicaceticum]ARE87230.1 Transposase IS66 family protein [Clostridium formicaceticum]
MTKVNLQNQLDEKTKELILKMEEELEARDNEIKSKDKEIADLKNELAYLKGQVLNKNRKIFGSSSEQTSSMQVSFFDEAEKESNLKVADPTIEEITYTRSKSSKNTGKKDNLANLEKVVIEHKLDENQQSCSDCSSDLVVIGKKSKEILKYIPAKLYVEEHVTYSYACRSCEESNDKANITTTKAPKTLLHKSMASNELLSHVINLKYQHALPLNRQESYFKMMGANLSRQTLANWVIGAAHELEPIYQLMKEKLLKRDYIQADETVLKVLDDRGKESNKQKYMWLYKSPDKDQPIIIYDYQKTRSGSCPKGFLSGFSKYIQTDGYAGYNKVENVKRLYCLAHIRRKFHEIIVNLDEEALKSSRALIGFNYCAQLYKIEKDLKEQHSGKEDFYERRYKKRLEASKPIIEEFIAYVDREIEEAVPKSALGKALAYAKPLLPSLKVLLEDGSLEIDNNAAERSIRPFVVGRSNWLFSASTKGAESSALIYSIIETARNNNLVVEKYLLYLMNHFSNVDPQDKESLLKLLPFSKDLPEDLKVQAK